MIGDEVLVTVMEISGSTVRLGIEAPQGISIFREEIWLAVKEENRAAAQAAIDALPPAGSLPAANGEAAAGQAADDGATGGEAAPERGTAPG